jgi:glyoxylase-like metal-dependent hydrolase (beta-lactamase superfamily II)
MNHRRLVGIGFGVFLAVTVLAASAVAQQAPPPAAPIAVQALGGDVYLISGGAGSNTGAIIGKDGVIIIDTKLNVDSGQGILTAVAKLTPKPVTTVILTHSDGDHVNGLAAFPKGLTIIAQTNCKAEMQKSQGTPQAAPADYMPTKMVDTDEKLTINGVRFELAHWAPAHTSGDLVIYLPDQKIVFTGDLIATQTPYPFIHLEKNGTSEGWITSVRGLLAFDANTFIPGHGEVQTRTQVQARLDSTIARRDQIKMLVAQGKSLDQIKQEVGDTAPAGRFPSFTQTVYTELTKQ